MSETTPTHYLPSGIFSRGAFVCLGTTPHYDPLHDYSAVHLFSIDQENGRIEVGLVLSGIREDCIVMGVHGNCRTVGFVTYGGDLSRVVTATSLDYPGVIIEMNLNVHATVHVSGH